MKRMASGDASAMHELVVSHGKMLTEFVGRFTAWHADHEDILQQVLVADHRLAMAPLLARLKIANVALDEYEKTAPVFDTIESLRREREFAFSNRDGIAEALSRIRREEAELNVLKQLISDREKSSAESKVLPDRN